MKALAIILAVLLVLAHPVAVIAVLTAVAAVCILCAWLACRTLRPCPRPYARPASVPVRRIVPARKGVRR